MESTTIAHYISLSNKILLLFLLIIAFVLVPKQKVSSATVAAQGLNPCLIGVSLVPCNPVALRTVVVAQDGSGQYTTIQAAIDASLPGDTIQVKNGTYNEAVTFNKGGTPDLPLTLTNYPGDTPVIVPGSLYGQVVSFHAQWIILQGFEITKGYDGIEVYSSHNIIRNNYIHNNGDTCDPTVTCGQGILVVSTTDVLIQNNTIARNGLLNNHPYFIHGIYLSDFYSTGVLNVTIAKNLIKEHGGAAIQAYLGNYNGLVNNNLVENNILQNNTHEIIFININNSTIRNNTIVHITHPKTDSPTSTMLWFDMDINIMAANNIFYSTSSGPNIYALKTTYPADTQTVVDYNLWQVPSNEQWEWQGTIRTDFTTQYKPTTGYDSHGPVIPTDPRFVSLVNQDYYLGVGSPARNAGTDTQCPVDDKDSNPRPGADLICDIGAYEAR